MDVKFQAAIISGAFLLMILLMTFTKRLTKKITLVKKLEPNRKKVVLNVFYFIYYLLFGTVVIVVLGIDFERISLFISSALAVLGIAFVAQWSLLSNLTASIIIFFYHPLKIGDRIKVLDKELDFTGVVKNITGFYVLIETDEKQQITIPNSIILQKGIELYENE